MAKTKKEDKVEKQTRYEVEIAELEARLEAALAELDDEEMELIEAEVNPLGDLSLFYAVMKISFLNNLIVTKKLLQERNQ